MTLLEIAQDFLAFSLAPFIPKRDFDILSQKIAGKDHTHELTNTIQILQELLVWIEKYQKQKTELLNRFRKPGNPFSFSETTLLYIEASRLNAHELLILLGLERYKIPISSLSLILNQPEESILFRHKQLLKDISSHHTFKPLNTKDFELLTAIAEVQVFSQNNEKPIIAFKLTWKSLPTPLRFLVELLGGFVLFGILLISIPMVRKSYEDSLQKRINEYLIDHGISEAPAPPGLNKPALILESKEAEAENTSDEDTAPSPQVSKKQPKVVDGETWRFSFTGAVASNEAEQTIKKILEQFKNSNYKTSVVPGGIQIDFSLNSANLIELKTQLEEMTFRLQRKYNGKEGSNNSALTPGSINMSWYKKNMGASKKLQKGQVQVIIWISTL